MANKKKVVLSNEKEVLVYKLKVKQIRNIAKLLSQLPDNFSLSGGEESSFILPIKTISGLVFEYFDTLTDLIADCTDLTTEDIEDLSLEDLTLILTTLYEVNQDFLGKYLTVEEEK